MAMISSQNKTITWKIFVEKDGELVSAEGIEVNAVIAIHEYQSIDQFSLDPVQETVYSIATLVGCFFLVLVIPLMIYFSATYREKRDEEIRLSVGEE
jgi:ACR3 family arsenite efflux pump ArsB